MDWQAKLRKATRPTPTRVSANGQIVLSAAVRRAVGIEPGDHLVAVALAPGTIVVEKIEGVERLALRRQYERIDNPLRGIWGADPDFWLSELRARWRGSDSAS
jgi:bifunctional DNA-binding transcriptional regulator/antitoxin component of YhaV-PrlF toxin-antitoxin module